MKHAQKLNHLAPYLFAQIDELIEEKQRQGKKLWILSKSDPDRPTNPGMVETLREEAVEPANHHYPDFDGLIELRQRAAAWYRHYYDVALDPETEILPLLGSKEGIAHLSEALLDPGDIALVPDPAFPTYKTGTLLAGATPFTMPLTAPDFLPRFADIPTETARAAKLMFLNYPHNPSGATVDLAFWHKAFDFAEENDIVLVNDHAYAMTTFRPGVAPSLLMVPESKSRCLEFFTFSKAFHMAGWRLGLAVGNAEVIRALKIIETHINAGIFNPIQYAGATALRQGLRPSSFQRDNREYEKRLTLLAGFFNSFGWELTVPDATVYLWVPAPQGMDGETFTHFLLDKAEVVVSPGSGFGEEGKEYVRICVTYPTEVVEGAIEAMTKAFSAYRVTPQPRRHTA
ncbi:LL-diaminopimelate aminotransferase [Peptococcaceae bacterium CEB3]|nr:LL-diaminopimelate aminotransferase [Peptococcaceae bacterium CEB3]